jgi:hypothetical protein
MHGSQTGYNPRGSSPSSNPVERLDPTWKRGKTPPIFKDELARPIVNNGGRSSDGKHTKDAKKPGVVIVGNTGLPWAPQSNNSSGRKK